MSRSKTRPAKSFSNFVTVPEVFADIHCVTTWSLLSVVWEGVSAKSLADMAGARENAGFVLIHSCDGYTTNLPAADFLAEDVLFALKYAGEPLPHQYGGPVRLVVPRLYFWKSAKWASKIEFIEKDIKGYWEQRGYHNHGDPWKEERYS